MKEILAERASVPRVAPVSMPDLLHLDGAPGVPSKEYFVGLAQLYVDDARFAENYGGQAGATFVRDAMTVYADRNL